MPAPSGGSRQRAEPWDTWAKFSLWFGKKSLAQKKKDLKDKLAKTIFEHYDQYNTWSKANRVAENIVGTIPDKDLKKINDGGVKNKVRHVYNAWLSAQSPEVRKSPHNLLTLIEEANETMIQKMKQQKDNEIHEKPSTNPWKRGPPSRGGNNKGGNNQRGDKRADTSPQSIEQIQEQAHRDNLEQRMHNIEIKQQQEDEKMSNVQTRTKNTEKAVAQMQAREFFDKISTEWKEKYETEEERNKICTIQSVKAFVDQFFAHKGYLNQYTQLLIKAKFYPWLETKYPLCVWKIHLTQKEYEKLTQQRQDYSKLFKWENMQPIKDRDGKTATDDNGREKRKVIWQAEYNEYFKPPPTFGGEKTKIDPDRANVAWKRYVTQRKLELPTESGGYLMAATPNPFILDLAL